MGTQHHPPGTADGKGGKSGKGGGVGVRAGRGVRGKATMVGRVAKWMEGSRRPNAHDSLGSERRGGRAGRREGVGGQEWEEG